MARTHFASGGLSPQQNQRTSAHLPGKAGPSRQKWRRLLCWRRTAATAALEWKDSGEAIRALCAGRIVELLDAAEAQKDSRSATRCRAGDALARLGDPRTWLLDVDQMRFCAVPGGAFWMGDKADKNAPLHLNESLTEGYWMAQAPVTVAQFRQCLTDAGRLPRDEDALKDLASRPVRHVSWHEAQDFCAWLNHRWQNRLPTGWRVALS